MTSPLGAAAPKGSRGWRPALRIAGRTVRRNLGRSLLVAALVAVPVAGATLVNGVYHSLSHPERDADKAMGDADALVIVSESERLSDGWLPHPNAYVDLPRADEMPAEGEPAPADDELAPAVGTRDPATVELDELLPAGTELTPAARSTWSARVVRQEGTTRARVQTAELNNPALEHRVRLESGRWPAAGDEVLINEPLADRLGLLRDGELAADATVRFPDGPETRVTGIGIDPYSLVSQGLFTSPGSAIADHLDSTGMQWEWSRLPASSGADVYLATFPDGTNVDALWPELADRGIALIPRAAYLNPDAYSAVSGVAAATLATPQALQIAALIALIVGLGLLEVVLLAGAAFAVGARRQVRDLGLVAAGGGTSHHVRRIVLAQGVVMGAIGALLGVAAGVVLTLAGRPLWQMMEGALVEHWRWGTTEVAIAAAVGLLSGLAAAVVPAVGAARRDTIDALAARFRATGRSAHLPKLGVLLVALGAAGALLASRAQATEFSEYAEELQAAAGTDVWVSQPNTAGFVALQLLGAVTAVAGMIITTPFLVTWIAGRVRRAPVATRFASRDAARHRHRTAPAVAAIMIVVAGASGVAYALAAQEEVDKLRFTPNLPDDVAGVITGLNDEFDSAVADGVAAELPDGDVIPVAEATVGEPTLPVDEVALPDGTMYREPVFVTSACIHDGTARQDCHGVGRSLSIASPELFELAYDGAIDDEARAALAGGKVVVPSDDFMSDDGMVHIEAFEPGSTEEPEPVTMPGHVVPGSEYYGDVPRVLISAEAAEAAGWMVVAKRALIPYDAGTATQDHLDRAFDAADRHGYVLVEPREPVSMAVGYIALAAGSAVVTLVGVGVVVSLAAAEGRADLATMAAVGAPPRRRRAIAGWQALFVAGLGSALGLALGTYYGFLTYPAIGSPSFMVPWPAIVMIGAGVPLLAAVIAVLFTRSRLPMIRRIE